MRAAQVVRLDGPEAIQITDIPDAVAADGQVLIEVHAAGVSYPDVLHTRGLYQYRSPLPFTLGSEVAGVVLSAPAGAAVSSGDRVAAFPGLGGFAEFVVASPEAVFRLPERVSFAAGAALPMNYLTVEFALRRRAALQAGETVLVHGAAGGVGSAAIQLARAMGARVLGVVSTEDKKAAAKAAGADEVVLAEGFLGAVLDIAEGGIDLVVDPVGGDRFIDSLRCLAPEGRLLVLGFTGGEIPTVKVNRLLLHNTAVIGAGWFPFGMQRPGFLRKQWAALLPHLESGALDPVLGRSFPLEDTAAALLELEQRRTMGKVIVEMACLRRSQPGDS